VVVLAAATAAGAWLGIVGADRADLGRGLAPLLLSLVAVAAAWTAQRPTLLAAGLLVLAAILAQRSLDGLHPPRLGEVRAEVTLLSDPSPTAGGGVRADARLDGKRLALSAHRAAAAALDDRLAGDRVLIIGEVSPPGPFEQRMLHRHLAGRLDVDVVSGWRTGDGLSRAANGLRRTLADGAGSLDPRRQALLMGLVLGDDRQQPSDLVDAFQAAGLSHLTAVSGQNVAFALLLVQPLVAQLRLAPRLVVVLAVLGGFALLTRFEPSVLRATAMAAIGAVGAATGRPSSGLRRLGLAAIALLLVDPLLVMSLGFRLSAAGSAGIIVLAGRLADWLPGPRWLTVPLGVTAGAQLAVAPLLVQTFGTVDLVSLPANLLAVPAAGPVMMWGLTGGFVAGLVGGPVAAVLHIPSRLLLAWIDAVATTAAARPLGEIRVAHLAVLSAALGLVWVAARAESPQPWGRGLRWAAALACVAVVASATLGRASAPPLASVQVGPGAMVWRGGGAAVVVLDGRATEATLLPALRSADVGRVDVLVVRTAADRALAVAARARRRWPSLVVLVPDAAASRIVGALAPAAGSTMVVGDMRLTFGGTADRLEPTIGPAERPP
jgi:competence protein ComEC